MGEAGWREKARSQSQASVKIAAPALRAVLVVCLQEGDEGEILQLLAT